MKPVMTTSAASEHDESNLTDARAAWNIAHDRHVATRTAIAGCLDNQVGLMPTFDFGGQIQPGEPEGKAPNGAYAKMSRRALMLADALQRHALMRIVETGTVLDDIDRAVAAARADKSRNE